MQAVRPFGIWAGRLAGVASLWRNRRQCAHEEGQSAEGWGVRPTDLEAFTRCRDSLYSAWERTHYRVSMAGSSPWSKRQWCGGTTSADDGGSTRAIDEGSERGGNARDLSAHRCVLTVVSASHTPGRCSPLVRCVAFGRLYSYSYSRLFDVFC